MTTPALDYEAEAARLSALVGASDDGWRRFQLALSEAAGCELPVVLTDACRHNPGSALLFMVVPLVLREHKTWTREKVAEVVSRSILVALLRYWRRASVKEVADELGVSEGTVKNDTALVLRAYRWDWDRLGTTGYLAAELDPDLLSAIDTAGTSFTTWAIRAHGAIVPPEGLDR